MRRNLSVRLWYSLNVYRVESIFIRGTAGWIKSSHGQQVRTFSEEFADTHFTAIHTSDLKRAFDTAKVLYDYQKDPKPSFDSSELLHELNVGRAAESPTESPMSLEPIPGLTWEQRVARGIYLARYSDDDRFPEGESIKDFAVRARTALEKLVLPHVW